MKISFQPLFLFFGLLIISISVIVVSCGSGPSGEQYELQQQDSIERARAAMDAAKEAALIKARIEDSLEQLQMVDSANTDAQLPFE